jgi:protein-disulfide isomerase
VTKPLRLAMLAGAALLLAAAAPKTVGWNYTVTLTPAGGHVLGNPAAKVKLVQYVSYTCPHCAEFEVQSDGPLRLGYIASGKVSSELRHFLRDPVDLTVAMLTNCGAKEKFFLNHSAFMRSQKVWIGRIASSSEAQRIRWTSGTLSARTRAVATDFKFYEIMASRGYDRTSTDRCLADTAMAQRLAKQTEEGNKLGVSGTPAFAIDGALLLATHDWALLRPQIDARM